MSRLVVVPLRKKNLPVPKGTLSVFFNNLVPKKYYSLSATKKTEQNVKCKTGGVSRLFSGSAQKILTSPLGPPKPIPNENVVEYIYKDNNKWMERPASTCGITGRSYTYGMIRLLINRCAKAFLGHCGMKSGEVVGVLLPNIPEFIITCHGAMEAGLVVSFVNPLYTPDEIRRQFDNAGAKMIITVPPLLEVATTISPQLPGYKATVCVGGEDDLAKKVHGLESLLSAGHEAELSGINPRDLAILPYSSGTTGLPKGVMLSHYNLVANMVQGDHPDLLDTAAKDGNPHTILSVLPFFHIFGFNCILNVSLKYGAHIINIPRFTAEDYIKTLAKYKPTCLFVVPSLLLFLATHPLVTKELLSTIETIHSGAAPLTKGLLHKFHEKIERNDVVIRQGYGMTESSPVTFLMPIKTPSSKMTTIGVVYPGTEARIVCLHTGEDLGANESGELLVRGPQVMMGYLNNEKATAETIDEAGWLHTGDVAYYDEDKYFFIVDRTKELIKVKGNQVSPTELENILLELEGVADVAVVGIPDELAGEVPRAFIVRQPNSKITEEDVVRFINPKVTHYKKIVGGVRFVESIPRNPSGKILRNILKAEQTR